MEKEVKSLENSEAEKVSGGKQDVAKISRGIATIVRKCPKCGKPMRQEGGYAFPGKDGKLHSQPYRTYCPNCDRAESKD